MANSKLDKLIKKIRTEFDDSVIKKASEIDDEIKVIPTSSLKLNLITNIGGLPRGYITEVFGDPGSGKSTLIMEAMAIAQKMKLQVVYFDIEHRFVKKYATSLGVDCKKLILIHPENAESALELAASLIELGSAPMIVFDSVAALLPAVEDEGQVGNAVIGVRARLISNFLRKITHNLYINQVALVMINRSTAIIGNMYGPTSKTTGGINLKHQSSIRLEIKRGKITMDKELPVSQEMKFRIVKNSFGVPYRKTVSQLILGHGLDQFEEILEASLYYGLIEQNTSMYKLGDNSFRGKQKLADYLKENNDVVEELKKSIFMVNRGEVNGKS